MVQALPLAGAQPEDYSIYGDYLLVPSDSEVREKVDFTARAMRPWFELVQRRYQSPVVLDFGCGAGYLAKAAEEFGFESCGIELSDKLVAFARERVKFGNVRRRIEDLGRQFDAIFMADVIEHLAPARSRAIMTSLLKYLKPGGVLIGNTPNIQSANILVCRERDAHVLPPSHICYFSLKTLDLYLASLGLAREILYSQGLDPGSFLRREKLEPSLVEKTLLMPPWREARVYLLPLVLPLKAVFRLGGRLVRPLGVGYQIYFAYAKPVEATRTPAHGQNIGL